MSILCVICKTEYILSSANVVNVFCKHVAKCPLRSNNERQERYLCSICQTVFHLNKSFKKHILKFHIGTGFLPQSTNVVRENQMVNQLHIGNF